MVGAIDVASQFTESPEEVADTLRQALMHADAERIMPCTNCGMAPLPRDVALAKLEALALGASKVRHGLSRP